MAKKQKGNQFLVIAIAAILVIALVLFFRGGVGAGEARRMTAPPPAVGTFFFPTGWTWDPYQPYPLTEIAAVVIAPCTQAMNLWAQGFRNPDEGGFLPGTLAESTDGTDNDCDGLIDELPTYSMITGGAVAGGDLKCYCLCTNQVLGCGGFAGTCETNAGCETACQGQCYGSPGPGQNPSPAFPRTVHIPSAGGYPAFDKSVMCGSVAKGICSTFK